MIRRFCFFICVFWGLCAPVQATEPFPAGAGFDVGFSPQGNAEALILRGINRAEKSILVAAFSFTNRKISRALAEARKRGVKVMLVADEKSNTERYSAVTFLANQGVPVRVNGNYAIFHHKFMVFDGRHVETGSFNFSAAAAADNAENVLMLWNVPDIAGIYTREWQRLWDEGKDFRPRY
ncbi:MAG: phospholipase D family protein [Desulfovibrionaceae bacterium]|nr:phospholipase D family protein [Desulfovibrionaceae bacterium]